MTERTQTWDVKAAIAAQAAYCEQNGYPHFAPRDGLCWSCRLNIYEPVERDAFSGRVTTGITVERAGSELITGCPHCHRSYCE